MSRVPGALHAVGRMPSFALSVRHRTPFPYARDSIGEQSTINHPPEEHQRIVRNRPASDRTEFELPRGSVQTNVGRQPPPTRRTPLGDAVVVRHDRLRRSDVDCLFTRRARNAVSRVKHGDLVSTGPANDQRVPKQVMCQTLTRVGEWFARGVQDWHLRRIRICDSSALTGDRPRMSAQFLIAVHETCVSEKERRRRIFVGVVTNRAGRSSEFLKDDARQTELENRREGWLKRQTTAGPRTNRTS